jgi:hypothetical protein
MRQGPHNKRGRGRGGNNNNRRSGTPNRNQTFDSNGPEVRIRGNANQVHEKYLNLARDASQNGDRVLAESYYQHAEHYFRIISTFTDETATGTNAGADPNRNRGNGSSHGYNDDASNSQFREDEPQPEVDPATSNAPTGQAAASSEENAAQPEAVAEIEPPREPSVEVQSLKPEATESGPGDTPIDKPREAAPATRPLSLRRRRNSVNEVSEVQGSESAKKAESPNEPVSPGVTLTVVGAPALDSPDTAAPPRPRRRPRAAAPRVQPEETPGD